MSKKETQPSSSKSADSSIGLAVMSTLATSVSVALFYVPSVPVEWSAYAAFGALALGVGSVVAIQKRKSEEIERRRALAKALERWQKEAQEQTKESERQTKLKALVSQDLQKEKEIAQNYLDVANIFLAAIADDGTVEVINRKGLEILGCQERDILGENFATFCVPDLYKDRVSTELTQALRGSKQILARAEYPINTKNGERLISWSNAVVRDASGRAKALLLCGEDVTDRRTVEARLQLMRMMLESVDEGVIAIDARGLVVWANPACERITGFTAKSIQGRPMGMIYPTGDGLEALSGATAEMMKKGSWKGEIASRHRNTQAYPQRLSLSAIKDTAGRVTHAVAVFSDITKEKEQEERVRYLASHDTLTGLPNRASFTSKLDEALARAAKNETKLAILFIDLDHFKKVNDTLGHEAGDDLLKEVAGRLRTTLREKDFIARLGGDEFTAIIEGITTVSDAQVSGEKLLVALSAQYEAVGTNTDIRVTPSIGVCMYPDDGKDAQSLLKKSDQAMYAVKSEGRAGVKFFSNEINSRDMDLVAKESGLRKAIDLGTLQLNYQPKVACTTGYVEGFEALCRWTDTVYGEVAPEEFIKLAEDTNMINDLGDWVFKKACEQLASWRMSGYADVKLAVNVSAKQFQDKKLAGRLARIMNQYEVKPGQIELELTESSLMKESKDSNEILAALKALGCSITIDDFGTGYSSLLRMKELPIDCVKIDKGFVFGAKEDSADGAICKAVVAMGHSMGIKVIAEGVETPEQLAFLKTIGVDSIQGFLYAKALPPSEAIGLLARDQEAQNLGPQDMKSSWPKVGNDILDEL